MKQKDLFKQLKEKLSEIQILIDQIEGAGIANIEKDLLLEKVRNLYDVILLNGTAEQTHVEKKSSPPAEKISTAEIVISKIEDEIQESETDQTEIDSEEIIPAKDTDADGLEDPLKVTIDLFSDSTSPRSSSISQIVNDPVPEEQEETVADKIQKNKINSLKEAIGINEKFFFINELFDGNLNEYNQTIENLDQIEEETKANESLDQLAEKYEWDKTSDPFEQLQQFVLRKYTL